MCGWSKRLKCSERRSPENDFRMAMFWPFVHRKQAAKLELLAPSETATSSCRGQAAASGSSRELAELEGDLPHTNKWPMPLLPHHYYCLFCLIVYTAHNHILIFLHFRILG
ncbi:hypothetical protein DAI22_07g273900 [Oryza sativa Japonica Group]|nr:hypothetical protein DAI22_07g273900 [Oryza sativa Japonica Group]